MHFDISTLKKQHLPRSIPEKLDMPHTSCPQVETSIARYDHCLLVVIVTLLAVGLLMVASTSVDISERRYGQSFMLVFRQIVYLLLGIAAGALVVNVKRAYWLKIGFPLIVLGMGLLFLVLVPGIGREINGSMRWLGFGQLGFHVPEFVKLTMIVYLAGYLSSQEAQAQNQVQSSVKPFSILAVAAFLLIVAPDIGASMVILLTGLGMFFLAGVRIWQFVILLTYGLGIWVMFDAPYRLARLSALFNPWDDDVVSSFCLAQSLTVFSNASWFGVGPGNSIYENRFDPSQRHTVYLFTFLVEELGFIGGLCVILLFSLLVWRTLHIGRRCFQNGHSFSAYLAYGIGLTIALQVIFNIGVNIGLYSYEGIALPLMSYGGNNLLITCIMLALLLRIDYEDRLMQRGFSIHAMKKFHGA